MSRYIDADRLCAGLKDMAKYQEPYKQSTILGVVGTIKNTPTADVVEVRHGEWIEHTVKPDWLEDDVEVFYNCSECGTSHWSISPPYCPNCGAKMDGERKEK